MIWITILPLIILALFFLLWPLMRSTASRTVLDHAIAQYEARKQELVLQHKAGLMSADDYRAAEIEQARALLALQAGEGGKDDHLVGGVFASASIRRRKFAAAFMLVALPVLSLALYVRLGQPTLPDRPLAVRQAEAEALSRAANVDNALTKIEAHLLKNPEDGKGFEVIAPVYMRMERFVDAAHAYGRVVALLGETPNRLADWGESLMAASGGVITEEAQAVFERAISLNPLLSKAQFYLARLKEQQGDYTGAHKAYVMMLATLPEGTGAARVREEITRLQGSGKIPPQSAVPPPPRAAADAITQLPADEQQRMIRAMVDGLTSRLEEKGGTVEEWLRLIQARLVLGERDKALAHVDEAIRIFGNQHPARQSLEDMRARVMAAPAAQEERKNP